MNANLNFHPQKSRSEALVRAEPSVATVRDPEPLASPIPMAPSTARIPAAYWVCERHEVAQRFDANTFPGDRVTRCRDAGTLSTECRWSRLSLPEAEPRIPERLLQSLVEMLNLHGLVAIAEVEYERLLKQGGEG